MTTPLPLNHDDVWRAHAACLDSDPDLWFPESGTAARARLICSSCPVREDCLQHALTVLEQYGIWGGASERVRRRLRADLGRSPHPGQPWRHPGCTCRFCTGLDLQAAQMAALVAGVEPPPFDSRGPGVKHGTPSCYPKGCRRPECLRALREWRTERRRLKRAEGEAS